MYEQTLSQAGLAPDQAAVYEVLLKNGPLPARKISQNTPYKRSLVYKILEELVKIGLVSRKDEVGKISVFEPAHPLKLKELAESREQQAKNARFVLDEILGQLTSDFNLISGKPGVKFEEGIEGVKKILYDSLTATDTIYSYIDNEAVNKFYPKVNAEYIKKRNQLKVHKKMLTIDSAFIRGRIKYFDPQTTEVRVIKSALPFTTVMQIYDNKVSYLTLDEKQVIGFLLQQNHIAQMHKILFEALWAKATPLFPQSQHEQPEAV